MLPADANTAGCPKTSSGGVPFHIEHIIARKHGGATDEENLALACPHCNGYKGTDIATLRGRLTASLLRMNHDRMIAGRRELIEEGRFFQQSRSA